MNYQVADFSEDNVIDVGTYDTLEQAILAAKKYIDTYQESTPLCYHVLGTLIGIDYVSDEEEDYNPRVTDNECDIHQYKYRECVIHALFFI